LAHSVCMSVEGAPPLPTPPGWAGCKKGRGARQASPPGRDWLVGGAACRTKRRHNLPHRAHGVVKDGWVGANVQMQIAPFWGCVRDCARRFAAVRQLVGAGIAKRRTPQAVVKCGVRSGASASQLVTAENDRLQVSAHTHLAHPLTSTIDAHAGLRRDQKKRRRRRSKIGDDLSCRRGCRAVAPDSPVQQSG
jgi:hypothetical protein